MRFYKLTPENFGKIAEVTLLSTSVLESLIDEGETRYVFVTDDGRCALRTPDEIIEQFTQAIFS